MNREELIEHWATDVVPAVFAAEDNIREELQEILEANMNNKQKGAKLYCRMIAEEIVSHTSDDELAQL